MEISLTITPPELQQCAALMYRSEPWSQLQFDPSACRAAFEGYNKEVYIAREQGQVAGFAILQTAGALSGYIQSICIAPEHQNKGLGTELICFCEERLFRDMPHIFLCVSSFNKAAQRFYYRLGYEKVGELKDHLIRGADEYLLRKSSGPRNEFLSSRK